MGVTLGVSSSLAPSLDLRLTGSLFSHSFRFSSSGFDAIARLRFASGRASLDDYPFHKAFRISPGVLSYNQNRITAADTIEPGSSFTLNGDTFYSARMNERTGASPVNGTALLNLHATRPGIHHHRRLGQGRFPDRALVLSHRDRCSAGRCAQGSTSTCSAGHAGTVLKPNAQTSQTQTTGSPCRSSLICEQKPANGPRI